MSFMGQKLEDKSLQERINLFIQKESSVIYEEREEDSTELRLNCYKLAMSLIESMEERSEKKVAVLLDRGPGIIYSMIASLVSGFTYVLIDSNLPSQRIKNIIDDSGVEILISDSKYEEYFQDLIVINLEEILLRKLDDNVPYSVKIEENELAYICYTSGSTGEPKGVEITRKGLFDFIDIMNDIVHFQPAEKIACLSSCSFDIFFMESVMPLVYGTTVCIAMDAETKNPRKLKKFLIKNQVSILQSTPSRLQMLLHERNYQDALKSVKRYYVGGETFLESISSSLQSIKEDIEIYNVYGPTEGTIWCTYKKITAGEKITIGQPLRGIEIKIVENGKECPKGQVGEICISSDLLAKGYHNKPELTTQSFVMLDKKRFYKTGDNGKVNEEGDICCLGRVDNQIKINGYRVELEEIENKIMQYQKIDRAVAYYIKHTNQIGALYSVSEPCTQQELQDYLSKWLPTYMIPSLYVLCDKWYYNNNGKIDRNVNFQKYFM